MKEKLDLILIMVDLTCLDLSQFLEGKKANS